VHRLVRRPAAAEQQPPAPAQQQPDRPAEPAQDDRWPLLAGGALLALLLVFRGVVRRRRYRQR
jgi:hypothetical protein